MRQRNHNLRTGSLLTRFDEDDRTKNASILFLVSGAHDIAALTAIEGACRSAITDGLEWHTVADHNGLADVDPCLDPERMSRLEAAELAGLDEEEIRAVLGPALVEIKRLSRPIFPDASLAVGAVAEGAQFIDRRRDIEALRRTILEEGRHALIVSPRRMGKTSLLRRLEEELEPFARVAFIDMERDATLEEAASRVLMAALRVSFPEARRQARTLGARVALRAAMGQLRGDGKRPVVMLLDELVWFLENLAASASAGGGAHKEGAREVLDFLKTMGDACLEAGALIVTASSRDLDDYARAELGLSERGLPPPFHELKRHALSPLSEPALKVELRRVLIGTGLVPEPGDLEWLAGNIDLAMPYVTMRFLSELSSRLHRGERAPHARGQNGAKIEKDRRLDAPALEEALRTFLDETDAFREIDQHIIRKIRDLSIPGSRPRITEAISMIMRSSDPASAPAAADIIHLLGAGDVSKGEELLSWLLDTLPIERNESGRVAWASRLFRRWWLRREGLGE